MTLIFDLLTPKVNHPCHCPINHLCAAGHVSVAIASVQVSKISSFVFKISCLQVSQQTNKRRQVETRRLHLLYWPGWGITKFTKLLGLYHLIRTRFISVYRVSVTLTMLFIASLIFLSLCWLMNPIMQAILIYNRIEHVDQHLRTAESNSIFICRHLFHTADKLYIQRLCAWNTEIIENKNLEYLTFRFNIKYLLVA